MNATNKAKLVSKIEDQLDRLDCLCTDENPGGLCVAAEPNLPRGWVRVYDSESVYGPADEILAALEEVDYDPEAIVGKEDPRICYDESCYGGRLPENADELHGHDGDPIKAADSNTGWEKAWEALSKFADHAPITRRQAK